MNDLLKIYLVHEGIVGKGSSFGYFSHQSQIKKALMDNGVIISDDADIALHICPLLHYEPIPNKINLCYTMYEFEDLNSYWIAKLPLIDGIIVPCQHNKNLFAKYTNGKIPIAVCPEGCNSDIYYYKKRFFPQDKPFRYYHFSVNNPRKGYFNVLLAWDKLMKLIPELKDKVELYIKASNGKEEKVFHEENVYFDNRTLTIEELVDLNHQANVFLFPSLGEGWGLTLIEAASTGLPCLYTNYSGPCDFMDETVGYPLNFLFCDLIAEEKKESWRMVLNNYTRGAYVTMQSILDNMVHVYYNYNEALEKGKCASERIKNNFTWDQSAKKLIKLINDFKELKKK